MVVANFVILTNTTIKLAMAIELSMEINTSAFTVSCSSINYHKMTITCYGLDAAGMNYKLYEFEPRCK